MYCFCTVVHEDLNTNITLTSVFIYLFNFEPHVRGLMGSGRDESLLYPVLYQRALNIFGAYVKFST